MTFEGGGPNFLRDPPRSANKGPMEYKESGGGGWGEASVYLFFFSKASVKAIKMPNFLLVLIEGI